MEAGREKFWETKRDIKRGRNSKSQKYPNPESMGKEAKRTEGKWTQSREWGAESDRGKARVGVRESMWVPQDPPRCRIWPPSLVRGLLGTHLSLVTASPVSLVWATSAMKRPSHFVVVTGAYVKGDTPGPSPKLVTFLPGLSPTRCLWEGPGSTLLWKARY